MTLKVSGNRIYIQNPNGTTKFDSDAKLLYRKYTGSGTGYIPDDPWGTTWKQSYPLGVNFNDATDFPLVTITPTSADGTVMTYLIGHAIPLNFTLLSNFHFLLNAAAINEYDVLTALVTAPGPNQQAHLEVSNISYIYSPQAVWYGPTSYISFNWKVDILSYR